jgi:hypothetical protein
MSKKGRADKRNHETESGNWKPGKWTPEHIARVARRAYRVAADECEQILGPHEGRVVAARLRSERDENVSVAALLARGVPLLGDQEQAG